MTDHEWNEWVRHHICILGVKHSSYRDLLNAWRPIFQKENVSFVELDEASVWMLGKMEYVDVAWRAHFSILMNRIRSMREGTVRLENDMKTTGSLTLLKILDPSCGALPAGNDESFDDMKLSVDNLVFMWRSSVRIRVPEPLVVVREGIEEMIASGIQREAIFDEIMRGPSSEPPRDRSEWLKQMHDRLKKTLMRAPGGSGNGGEQDQLGGLKRFAAKHGQKHGHAAG